MDKEITREKMLAKIYEVIADKTISFWCEVYVKEVVFDKVIIVWKEDNDYLLIFHKDGEIYKGVISEEDLNRLRFVRWHPVMIWNILTYIKDSFQRVFIKRRQERNDYGDVLNIVDQETFDLINLYRFPDKPIDEQDDECIKFVYDLLPAQ